MPDALPVEIVVTEGITAGTQYDFPARRLGRWRWLGLVPVGFGIGMMGFVAFWTVGFVGGLRQVLGEWGWLAGLFAIPFIIGALSVIALGLAVLVGRSQLRVTDRHLIAVEKLGWLGWRRRIQRTAVARLKVFAGFSGTVNGEPREFIGSQQFSVLVAELHNGKSQILVPGYPRDWLLALANQLASQLAIDAESSGDGVTVVPVEVVDSAVLDRSEFDRFEPPAGTRIEHQSLDDGCIFTVPAPGVWKGSKGLFGFSLLWCGFMVVFTTGVGFAFLGGNGPKDEARWIFPLFIVGFWAVGIGMMVASINMGRRQAAIAVTNGGLKTIVSGMFGTTRKEWPLTDLQTARKGPSGMEVNDVPVMQLHIVPRVGSPQGLLTGLDEPELEWIATHLRRYIATEDVEESLDRRPD